MSKSELNSRDRYEETAKIPSKPLSKNDKYFMIVVGIIIFIIIPVISYFLLN